MKARFKTRLFWILFCACLVLGCAFFGKGRVAVADEDPKYTVTLTGLARPIDGEAPSFAVSIVEDSTLAIWGSVWGDGDGNFMKYSSDAMKSFYARAAGQDVASFYELDKFVEKEKYYFNAFLTSATGISSLSAGDDVEVILKDKDGNVIDGVRVEGTYIPTWMLKLQMPSGMELPSGLNSSAAIIMISTGAIYGSPTDHIHNDNDVEYNSDFHWDACSVCGARMGEKETHEYYSNEATTWKYEAPTADKEGKYYITCDRSHCDAEYMTITIPKTNTADYKVVETYAELLAEVAKGTKYIKLKSARGNGQQFVSKESVTSPIVLDNVTADVTIDLNGYGLTFEKLYATEMIRVKKGKLTIIDKSLPTTSNYQLWFASSNMQRGIYVEAGGELVISNVSMYTYICNLLNQYPVIESEGKLTIQGGRYANNNSTDIRSNSTSCAILVRGGTATINGGLFKGQSCAVMVGASLSGYPTLTVNYGYFIGDKALTLGANGSAVINGGRFEPRYKVDTDYVGYGVYKMNTAGSLVINGGDFSGRYAGLYIDGKKSSTIINGGCFEVLKGTRIASYEYAALLVPVNPEGSVTINHASFYGERCIGAISSVLGEKISLNQIIPTDNRVSVDNDGESYDKTVLKNYHGTDNICVREGVLTGTVQLAHPAWYGSANHLTYTGVVAHLPKSDLTFAWEYKDTDGVWKDISGGNTENYTCTDSSLIGKKIRVKITATGFTGKAVYSDEYEMKKATRGNAVPAAAIMEPNFESECAIIKYYYYDDCEYVISDSLLSKAELEPLWKYHRSDIHRDGKKGIIEPISVNDTIYVYVRYAETTTHEAGSAYATTIYTHSTTVPIKNILLGDYNTNGTIMIEKGKSVTIPISYSPLNSNDGTDYWFEVPTGGVAVSGTGIGTSTSNKTTVASKPATITLTGTTAGTHYLNLYHSEGGADKVSWQTWKVLVYEPESLDKYAVYTDTLYTDITIHAGEKIKLETPNLLPKCDGLAAYEPCYYFYTVSNGVEVTSSSNEYATINSKTGEITGLKTTTNPIMVYIGVKRKADDSIIRLSSANPKLTVAADSAILVSSVTLNKSKISLGVGASEKLTATVAPADATDQKVVFTSNNSTVATVLQDGTVVTYVPGTATITATCGGKSASCTVTVNAKSGYTISGTISGSSGADNEIEISLYNEDKTNLLGRKTYSGDSSSYILSGILPGNYVITINQLERASTSSPISIVDADVSKNLTLSVTASASSTQVFLVEGYGAYQIIDSVTNPDSAWTVNNVFSGLYPNTEYTFRMKDFYDNVTELVVKTAPASSNVTGEYIDDAANKLLVDGFKFTHNVAFNNNLNLHYYVNKSFLEGYINIRLYVEKESYKSGTRLIESKIIPISDENISGGIVRYHFILSGIPAKEIGDEVYVTLYCEKEGITYITPIDSYSIREYAYNRLAKSSDDTFKRLMVDLLNYCSEAQNYFGYHTTNLVNSSLTEAQKALGSQEDAVLASCANTYVNVGASANIPNKNIAFDDNIKLYFYMTFAEGQDMSNVKLKLNYTRVNGTIIELEYPASRFVFDSIKVRYGVYCDTICIADLGCPVTATIYDGDVAISNTIVYSVETYAYNRINASNSEEFKRLLKAMMKFSRTARTYFEK